MTCLLSLQVGLIMIWLVRMARCYGRSMDSIWGFARVPCTQLSPMASHRRVSEWIQTHRLSWSLNTSAVTDHRSVWYSSRTVQVLCAYYAVEHNSADAKALCCVIHLRVDRLNGVYPDCGNYPWDNSSSAESSSHSRVRWRFRLARLLLKHFSWS